ncbi:Hypothetical protein, putative [Bodo saltans]|uniref:Bms1-type G domain-containing protein n=1 Tax=Bodo saltans TaxID=75058 RepID=A0A0S4KP78_BODSA|nr:Hypothetical protein, putative [Bodo saltans]|eukprot:CUI14705.1 Hypothetical protein, putative [Bodo saltans]
MEGDDQQRNKAHKSRVTGNKASRRDDLKKKKAGIDLEPNRGSNPKAFGGPSANSRKSQQKVRSFEKKESVLHVPSEDKTLSHLASEPPLLVAVVGPPGVGKTTLIRSMVKFYSGRNVQNVRGPITIVAGKSRRVTFLECPNNLSAMCDVAKVADLILLMVDGNFGFEMETFEFLNIAQIHGFPKIFGIVSHLDQMKTTKALKKQKKFLRHRFWHEVAAGAKMLCLSPMIHNMYRPNDVLKLHRLLICVQTKVQNWRNTHSCVLIDRHEDVTPSEVTTETPNADRTIAFYGYVRGKPMKPDQLVHIPGLGDFPITHISKQEDPCHTDFNGGSSQGHKMRHLNQKQKKIYAPYSDVGGVIYDDHAIYLQEDGDKQNIIRSGEGFEMLKGLQTIRPMDDEEQQQARDDSFLVLRSGADGTRRLARRPVNFKNDESLELDMEDPTVPQDSSDDSSSDDDDLAAFGLGDGKDADLDDDDDDALPDLVEESLAPRLPHDADSVRVTATRNDWSDASLMARVKELFVTGSWKGQNPSAAGGAKDVDDAANDDLEEKGYASDDEEFEREIRGEVIERDNEEDSDDDEDDGKDEPSDVASESEDEAHDDLSSMFPKPTNALSAIASSGLHGATAANAAFATKKLKNQQPKSALVAVRDPSKFASGAFASSNPDDNTTTKREGDDDDDFDILATSEEQLNAGDFQDDILRGLVSHFTKSSHQLKDEEGIEVVDHENRFAKRYVNEKEQKDEEELGAAIEGGGALTDDQEKMLQKRMAKKKAFDEDYDVDGGKNNTMSYYHHLQREVEQRKKNLDEAMDVAGEDDEQKIRLVGYFSGLYVRFVIENVPVEFIRAFNPSTPLIAGGLNFGEDQMQIVHAKIKRHRWYPKILKAQDPLVISIGWRRIQTQPIFAQEDPNGRHRYLKYTPLHMHCYCAFYAPVAPTNTGFIALPCPEVRTSGFRCLATGYTVGNDSCTAVVKKLKLTGTPQKVQKTTAFIKSLFNSDIEAAKFIGAKLKTVSGIRGMIKSVIKGKNGIVRCTFEDKILPSDIVFIRSWKPVDPNRFCITVKNLVDPNWTGMKTMRQLRLEHNLPIASNPDSEYREIKRRREVNFDEAAKVMISRNTRMALPFDMKEEFIPLAKSDVVKQRIVAATTRVVEPKDMRRQALIDTFQDKADAMDQKRKETRQISRDKVKRAAEREEEEYEKKLKKAKKETARKQEFRTQHKSRNTK